MVNFYKFWELLNMPDEVLYLDNVEAMDKFVTEYKNHKKYGTNEMLTRDDQLEILGKCGWCLITPIEYREY